MARTMLTYLQQTLSFAGPLTKEAMFAKFSDFLNDPELKLLNRSKFRELVDCLCVVKEGSRLALKTESNMRSKSVIATNNVVRNIGMKLRSVDLDESGQFAETEDVGA